MSSIVLEPATWYWMKAVCRTAATADGEPCVQYDLALEFPQEYSNGGHDARIVCAPCGRDMEIVEAVRLDPQPEMA